MIINLKAKDMVKNGDATIAEFNNSNDSLIFDFNSSRFINKDYTLEFPEVDIPDAVKHIYLQDLSGGMNLKVSVDTFKNTLQDGYYKIPYDDWKIKYNVF